MTVVFTRKSRNRRLENRKQKTEISKTKINSGPRLSKFQLSVLSPASSGVTEVRWGAAGCVCESSAQPSVVAILRDDLVFESFPGPSLKVVEPPGVPTTRLWLNQKRRCKV